MADLPPLPPKEPPNRWPLQYASAISVALGMVGMVVSFSFQSMNDPRDIAAGNAGFVAGAILIGSGLIALAILARRD